MKFISVEEIENKIQLRCEKNEEITNIDLSHEDAVRVMKQTFQILCKNMTSDQKRDFFDVVQSSNTRRIINESY